MRIVNNWLRNSMGTKIQNSLIICSIKSDNRDELNIYVIICK